MLGAARRLRLLNAWCAETTPASAARAGAARAGRTELRHAVAHSDHGRGRRSRGAAEITGARIAIVHLLGGLREVMRAARGSMLAETCPQYLFVAPATRPPTRDAIRSSFRRRPRVGQPSPSLEGARRRRHRSVVVGPFPISRRQARKSATPGFDTISIPGIETRLPLLFSRLWPAA